MMTVDLRIPVGGMGMLVRSVETVIAGIDCNMFESQNQVIRKVKLFARFYMEDRMYGLFVVRFHIEWRYYKGMALGL
jgi:hypothetical protein